MASQAETSIQGQSGVSMAAPGKTTIHGNEPFSSITRNNRVAFKARPTDNIPIQRYSDAFVTHVPPEDVVPGSRIFNGRVVIY